jgi:hypothetical protein
MPLDARDFLTCVIAFAVGILYTLGINDAKIGLDVASLSGTRRANLIFLMPVLAGSLPLLASHSTAKSNDVPSAISENRSVSSAIGNRFSANTAPHKKSHINQLLLVAFSSSPLLNNSRICSNWSRLMSLGYFFLIPLLLLS